MLIMTEERCPECDQIVYMKLMPKKNSEGVHGAIEHITSTIIAIDGTEFESPHTGADGIYLDKDGVCCVTMFDEDTQMPDYVCIFCNWVA